VKKYKDLLILLVVFGAIHAIFTGAIIPALTKWMMSQGFENKTFPNQISYMVAFFQYSPIIIWIPVSVWIYRDSKKEMFAPWLWAILILIAHYQGLIIYLLLRLIIDKEKVIISAS
jgi:hypothetical protein